MARLALAREDQVDQIYRESHRVWGAGLRYEDYRDLWRDLSRTPWGRRFARFFVWADGDRVLSSMKLYRPRLQLLGRTQRVTIIGALFTPAAMRGQGHATRMLRAAIQEAFDRGERLALLFSDIGTGYYASFGFRSLPAEEQWGPLPRRPPRLGRDLTLRAMRAEDHEAMLEAHDEFCRKRPIAVIRDAEHWQFLWVRSDSFFRRLKDPGLRQSCWVGLSGGRFAGYLIAVEGAGEWNVREVGSVGGDPETMAAILRLGAERARREGMHSFYGWLPPDVRPHLRDWRMRSRPRRRAVPMILEIRDQPDLSVLCSPGVAFLPFQDQF